MRPEVMERPAREIGMTLRRLRGMNLLTMGPTAYMQISKILMVKDELELSNDQVVNLRALRAELAQSLIRISADMRIARINYLQSIGSKPINFDQIRANARKLSDLRLQRKFATIDAFEKGLNLLNNGQKNTLIDILSGMIDESEPEFPEFLK